eukprot:TRINITY_DN1297_c0_g1_i1.p1 TRINITY_DN1297_c0_g1~~TRINITY_DN1297_c0_g1_i1.p1  ORF type:complete len:123 (-),score=30.00 TRINITY_DN1297_c0_g1_i1:234-602(-)
MTRSILLNFADAMKYAKQIDITFTPMAGRHGAVRELISRLRSDKVLAANPKLKVDIHIVHDGESPKVDVVYANDNKKTFTTWAKRDGEKDVGIDALMKDISSLPQLLYIRERMNMKMDDDGK